MCNAVRTARLQGQFVATEWRAVRRSGAWRRRARRGRRARGRASGPPPRCSCGATWPSCCPPCWPACATRATSWSGSRGVSALSRLSTLSLLLPSHRPNVSSCICIRYRRGVHALARRRGFQRDRIDCHQPRRYHRYLIDKLLFASYCTGVSLAIDDCRVRYNL